MWFYIYFLTKAAMAEYLICVWMVGIYSFSPSALGVYRSVIEFWMLNCWMVQRQYFGWKLSLGFGKFQHAFIINPFSQLENVNHIVFYILVCVILKAGVICDQRSKCKFDFLVCVTMVQMTFGLGLRCGFTCMNLLFILVFLAVSWKMLIVHAFIIFSLHAA